MTSEEIKARVAMQLSERDWLREIAYQLALLNEKQAPVLSQLQPKPPKRIN